MSSNRKRGNGVSPTTIVLVLVLLGAVAGASRLVVAPPALPPEPEKKPAGMSEQDISHARQKQEQDQRRTMEEARYGHMPKIPKVEDPNTIDVSSRHFILTKPGEAGYKQTDEELKKRKAEYAAYLAKVAAFRAQHGGKPVDKPVLTPHMDKPQAITPK